MPDRHVLKMSMPQYFRARDGVGIATLGNATCGQFIAGVMFAEPSDAPLIIKVAKRLNGLSFLFPIVHDGFIEVLHQRWLALVDLFYSLNECLEIGSYFEINLDDFGNGLGFNFCDNRFPERLIPDSDFWGSGGYASLRTAFARNVGWHEKEDIVFWRGTTTGRRDGSGLLDSLPRVRLARLLQHYDFADCGFNSFFQISQQEAKMLVEAGLQRDFIDSTSYDRFKYHIDVDGNTNAWSGLFTKLLSGGVVVKIESEYDYRQWYYDKLKPWVNFVPARHDMSDLIENLHKLFADQKGAAQIGEAGKALANSTAWADQLSITCKQIQMQCEEIALQDFPLETVRATDHSNQLLAILLENAVTRSKNG